LSAPAPSTTPTFCLLQGGDAVADNQHIVEVMRHVDDRHVLPREVAGSAGTENRPASRGGFVHRLGDRHRRVAAPLHVSSRRSICGAVLADQPVHLAARYLQIEGVERPRAEGAQAMGAEAVDDQRKQGRWPRLPASFSAWPSAVGESADPCRVTHLDSRPLCCFDVVPDYRPDLRSVERSAFWR